MKLELWVVRHAPAEDEAPASPTHAGGDDARPLTKRGARRFAQQVRGLERLGARFDRLLHSPKLRALETAELLAPLLEGESEVTPLLAQAPGEPLLDLLRRRADEGARLCVVGHEPWLSELALWLALGWRVLEPEGRQGLALAKGGVLVLEGEPRPGRMRLSASYPPRSLRRLARAR